jgi:hypothetical protein
MTDDDLIAKTTEALRRLEARRTEEDDMRAVTVDSLPLRRIEGTTIRFEREGTQAHIEVLVKRDSGEIISASYFLPPPFAT